MSKTAEKIAEMKIPKFMRNKFFGIYCKYYRVPVDEIVDPINSFETLSAFFTRQVKPRPIPTDPDLLLSPCDSKILKISEVVSNECSIIKGASYSFGELITGKSDKLTREQIQ
jgi:phosphatidylserine decarboxylase